MCEHCSDGSIIWAAIPRLAAYAKLSDRQVQRLIINLSSRGILSQLAPANSKGKRAPATYRINEVALEDDPRVAAYRSRQQQLPGVRRISAPSEPVTPCRKTPDTMSPVPVTTCRKTGDTLSPDSRFHSRNDPKPKIQHGDAELNAMPAWLAFKEQLHAQLSESEFDLWVRSMLLLKLMTDGTKQHFLAALPRNGRIQSAAMKRLPMMRELLTATGLNISLTRYPDDWEISEAKTRYGVDMAPKPWTREGSA